MECFLSCVFHSDVFLFKKKKAYEMRSSDWSSDVCSSDLEGRLAGGAVAVAEHEVGAGHGAVLAGGVAAGRHGVAVHMPHLAEAAMNVIERRLHRSEEHTSELQSLMRSSYAVFCLKKKNQTTQKHQTHHEQIHKRNRIHNQKPTKDTKL